MPVLTAVPDALRPYRNHGIVFNQTSGDQAIGDCPFCGKEGKFAVNVKDGRFKCRVCATGTDRGGGNATTFIRLIHEQSPEPSDDELEELRRSRKLLYAGTLRDWGVRRSFITREWVIPGYNQDGGMVQLYTYAVPPTKRNDPKAKRTLLPTAGLSHGLFGMNHYDKGKPDLWVCEGPWDGMAAYEVAKMAKRDGDKYVLTGAVSASVFSTTNIVAVPGVTTFPDRWCPIAADKRVALLYDNDHPKEHPPGSGKYHRAGWDGMRYVTRVLANAADKPAEVRYLTWGDNWQKMASGYDIRDHLSAARDDTRKRVGQLRFITDNLEIPPDEWIPGRTATARKSGGTEIELLECTSWQALIAQWRKAMKWSEPGIGLDHALATMLASVASTRMPEDQVWVTIISPPSTGKTTLAEALGLCHKWTKEVSTFRGFHSGFQTDSEAKEDHSLLNQIRDKTLIIKDADPILRAPNRDQIFAEMRDAYDTNSSVNYRNKVKRSYKGYRFSTIMCGTEALLEMDSAELGARFLMCIIMEGINEELEIEVNRRRFWQLVNNRGVEANGDLSTHYNPEVLKAKQMTGGYVMWLRQNATDMLNQLDMSNANEIEKRFDENARFVACMRSRPSKKQEEVATREMSARLCSQLTKAGLSLAVVLNKKSIDKEVLERVRRLALDTSRGRMLVLAKLLYESGTKGTSLGTLCSRTSEPEESERKMLRHLTRIGVAEVHKVNNIVRWRLTKSFTTLYKKVIHHA